MKNITFGCCFLLVYLQSFSQTSPVKWTFSAKKKTSGEYTVYLAAMVPSPWHIYSQNTPSGGPLPTKITFSKNPLLSITDNAAEEGKAKTIHDKNFGVDVIYFQNDAKFVQTVTLKAAVKTSLHGTVEYMVCNDNKCLPPVTIPFDIILN
jgi:thiol:disulfide interchange protein DsbD